MFHCACRQEGIDVIYHLSKALGDSEVSFHYFRTIDEFLILSQRYNIDLAVIAGKGDFQKELALIRLIKSHIFLSIIPTVLYHPDPSEEILITGFPNSGTSFLCNLIVALGKSAGSSQNLKKGDKHNRWGYFEHSKLGEVRWRAMQKV